MRRWSSGADEGSAGEAVRRMSDSLGLVALVLLRAIQPLECIHDQVKGIMQSYHLKAQSLGCARLHPHQHARHLVESLLIQCARADQCS